MPILYEKSGKTVTITLDNPPLNVFTPAMHRDLHAIITDFLADDGVSVGILTGAGTRAFCAGDDVKSPRIPRTVEEKVQRYMSVRTDNEPLEYPGWEFAVTELGMRRFKPMLGAVNGHALGQGLAYLLHLTDIRIASSTASFGFPEIAYGMGGLGGTTRLLRQMPPTAAMWLLLTGDRIDAEAALRCHLVNEITAPDQLLDRAHAVADRIARHPLLGLRTEMEASYRAQDMTREHAAAYSSNLYQLQRAAFHDHPVVVTRSTLGSTSPAHGDQA
jgi:enoyl-CoA hydratase/carnithine racemase